MYRDVGCGHHLDVDVIPANSGYQLFDVVGRYHCLTEFLRCDIND